MSEQALELNVIPLNIKLGKKRFGFFTEKPQKSSFAPLYTSEIPEEYRETYDILYTDFREHEDADISFTVSLKESPMFAKHYLNASVYRWFKERAYLRRKNFINNNELYFLNKKNGATDEYAVFDRFRVRASIERLTDKPELTLMYGGKMKVLKSSILEYPGQTQDFTKVVYKKNIYKYEYFNEEVPDADRREVFPVLNREIARTLSLPRPPWKRGNRLKKHTEQIYRFYERWICDPEFQKEFKPSPDGFLRPGITEFGRIDESAATLRFGGGITDKSPMDGLKQGGPFRAPDIPHVELFFIIHDQDRDEGNKLYEALDKGEGFFKGLKSFARIPVYVSNFNVVFKNLDNPLPEIERQLQNMDFKEGVQYGAIYLSPIEKNDPDPEKHRVYFRIKETLLKYGVTSQVISNTSVHDPGFQYYLPNIATALVAKLGGIPWTLEEKKKKELVIGIGAYRPKELDKTYLGSAFCFLNNGKFKGFESFTADDMLMLAGSFQRAIKDYRETYLDVERVVLHYYKRLNREEARVLKAALKEMKLDIPLIILTIHKSGSRDLVITDMKRPDRLPLSGTYFQSGVNQFLLCNNTRFDEPGEKIRSYPMPVKVYVDIAGETDVEKHIEDKEWIHELLEQVYQFSRLNWQTVSVKEFPVTLAYAEMVAKKFPYFDGEIIPAFGKRNFWFL